MRNWNIDEIKNSSTLHDDVKEIMLQEYYGHSLSPKDPNNYSARIITFREFKQQYYTSLTNLINLLGINYFNASDIHLYFPYDNLGKYEFESSDIDEEDLVEYAIDFYADLGDKEMLEQIKHLLDPEKQFVRIKPYDAKNPICHEVRGRCIKPQNTSDVYMSYYMRGTSEDLSIFAHETGHMLSHALFHETLNPVSRNFLCETESYLMELLMNTYIANNLKLPELALHLEANRTAKIVDVAWNIRSQQILYRQFGRKPNIKRLMKKLQKDGFGEIPEGLEFADLVKFTLFELNHLLHSYLIALHFYNEVCKDHEKGLYEYKKFMQSQAPTSGMMFRDANIDYEDLLNKMNYMYEKAVSLKLTHTDI